MGVLAQTQLIPIQELTPGQVGAIRNVVKNNLVSKASHELNLPEDKLVVRDVRPVEDLAMYASHGSAATVEDWLFTSTASTGTGFVTVTGTATMDDNRYVALFGVRDYRLGIATVATAGPATLICGPSSVSLVKINVGGADKVVWDTKVMQAYSQDLVAFTPSPVIIPQNVTYNIYYYKSQATNSMVIWLQLIGLVVEPRGKTISP